MQMTRLNLRTDEGMDGPLGDGSKVFPNIIHKYGKKGMNDYFWIWRKTQRPKNINIHKKTCNGWQRNKQIWNK
jgi:hypothetical protein